MRLRKTELVLKSESINESSNLITATFAAIFVYNFWQVGLPAKPAAIGAGRRDKNEPSGRRF
jgi:hypothetical protein